MKWIQEMFLTAWIPAAVIILAAAGIAAVRRRRALTILLGNRAAAGTAVNLSRPRRILKWGAALLAVLFLLGAAARPYWDFELLPTATTGRDVVVLFDVSKSMYAADPAPSRLAHAKQLLRQVVERSPGDRFAIIAFAGSAYTLCPLTADHSALLEYVEELSPAMAPYGGTNLERALAEMEKAFFAAEGTRRTVLLLTDGEELTGSSAGFIGRLNAKKIPLIVVGIGDPAVGAPVTHEDGSLMRDPVSGQVVTSRLNETLLRRLASESGGIYVHSTATHTGLGEIQKMLSAAAVSSQSDHAVRTRPVERFPILLGIAVFFLLLALFLPEYANRTGRAKTLLFLMAALPWLIAATPAEENAAAKVAATPPRDPYLRYNLARKLQSGGQLKDSAQLYESVIAEAEKSPPLRARSFYNLGVGAHQEAKKQLQAAQNALQRQQPDQAQSLLGAARQTQHLAETLYGRALASGSAPGKDLSAALLQLASDRRKTEKLEKEVKKLQDLQKQAQQDAGKAQKQNRQQNQKQEPENQQKKDSQAKSATSNSSSAARNATEQARQSAENLRHQAAKLNQKKQAEDAQSAAEELQKAAAAQAKNRRQEAQKHLDEAVKKLGAAASGAKKEEPGLPQSAPEESKKTEGTAHGDGRAEDSSQREKEQSVAAQLNVLNAEAGELRKKLRQQRRQPQVEKDW